MSVSDRFYQGRIDATGSPLAYAVVGLSSSGRYEDDLRRFTIAALIAFVASMGLLCRLLGFSTTATVVAAGVFSLCFAPMLADLRAVNVNQLQLLFLSLFLWLNYQKRPALAGAVLGIGIAFKPNIAAVLVLAGVVALVDGRIRESGRLFIGAAAGIALGVAVGAAYFGTVDVWGWFLTSIGRTLQTGYPLELGNYALASLIAAVTSTEVAPLLAILALATVVVVLVSTRRPSESRPVPIDQHFLIVGIGCVVMLLGSRLVWIHYYVLLIPLSLYLLRPVTEATGHRFGPVAAGLALLLLSPAAHATTGVFGAVTANFATALLFGAGLYSWWMVRQAPHPAPAVPRRRARGPAPGP
jgi:hypothetical protein